MSGPKVSAYRLEQNRREILMIQNQIFSCAAAIRNTEGRIAGMGGRIDELIHSFELIERRGGEGAEQIRALQENNQAAKEKAAALNEQLKALGNLDFRNASYKPAEIEKHRDMLSGLLKKIKAIKSEADSVSAKLKCEIQRASLSEEDGLKNAEKSIMKELQDEVSFLIREGEAGNNEYGAEISAIQRQLHDAAEDRLCPEGLRAKAYKLIERIQHMDCGDEIRSMKAISIDPLIRECAEAVAQKQIEYENLVGEYQSLCILTGCEAKQFPQSEEGITALNREIERLQAVQLHHQEQEYISDCISQVMREMGYDLIGDREVVKKSGRRFRNDLYLFDEGRALSVTHSADGQITMELGGVDHGDRLPDAGEAALLKDDMEEFCGKFGEIERRLREKGVCLKERVEMLPPDEAYAAIINLKDYCLRGNVQVHTLSDVRRDGGQQIRRTMRNED